VENIRIMGIKNRPLGEAAADKVAVKKYEL
jgi:hypothetical protein